MWKNFHQVLGKLVHPKKQILYLPKACNFRLNICVTVLGSVFSLRPNCLSTAVFCRLISSTRSESIRWRSNSWASCCWKPRNCGDLLHTWPKRWPGLTAPDLPMLCISLRKAAKARVTGPASSNCKDMGSIEICAQWPDSSTLDEVSELIPESSEHWTTFGKLMVGVENWAP